MFECRGIHLGYHIGLGFLLFGFVLFLVGFGCPFWTGYPGFNIGLWLICSQRDCRTISTISTLFSGGWWPVVQFFQCAAMLCLLPACVHAVCVTWVTPRLHATRYIDLHTARRHRRFLLTAAAVGGSSGFLGDMVFVGKVTTGSAIYRDVSWAFALNLTGCLFALAAAIIIAISGRLKQHTSSPNGASAAAGETTPPPFCIATPEEISYSVWSSGQVSTRL